MEKKEIIEYLGLVKKTNTLINTLNDELIHIKDMAEKITSSYEGIPTNKNINNDTVGVSVQKIMDLEFKINDEIVLYLNFRKEVFNNISKLNSLEFLIIYKYYMQGKEYYKIADELEISERQVRRLKNQAIDNLTFIEWDNIALKVKNVNKYQ